MRPAVSLDVMMRCLAAGLCDFHPLPRSKFQNLFHMHQAWPVYSKSAGYMHTTAMAAPAGAESGKEWMDNEMQGK